MSVITYDIVGGTDAINSVMPVIEKRYADLKQKMTQEVQLKTLRNSQLTRIRQFLTTFNTTYAKCSPSQIESLLKQSIVNSISPQMSSYLTTIASNSTQLLSNKIGNNLSASSQSRMNMVRALGGLYSLYLDNMGKGQVSIDANSFEQESKKLLNALVQAGMTGSPQSSLPQGLRETGNALGHAGAISGALLAQNVVNDLITVALPKHKNTIVYDTGTKKVQNTNTTITTDTLAVSQIVSGYTSKLMATLNISDKFNTVYRPQATSTGRAVKLATRTITTFLEQVPHNNLRDAYEIALMNYLSYHAMALPDDGFLRVDFLKGNTRNSHWNSLRRTIGAEMLYNELFGSGKGVFLQGNHKINDTVDLYVYGDKIFLADDIIRSKQTKKGFRDFNMAQISLAKRNQLLSGSSIQSLPKKHILKAPDPRENYVANILSTTTISYSQVVKF